MKKAIVIMLVGMFLLVGCGQTGSYSNSGAGEASSDNQTVVELEEAKNVKVTVDAGSSTKVEHGTTGEVGDD